MDSNLTLGKEKSAKSLLYCKKHDFSLLETFFGVWGKSYVLDIILLMGKIEWIKPHLVENGKTVFEMSAELISTLIPNDSKLSLALAQDAVLSMATQ